jgi:hypothetical protein
MIAIVFPSFFLSFILSKISSKLYPKNYNSLVLEIAELRSWVQFPPGPFISCYGTVGYSGWSYDAWLGHFCPANIEWP